MATHKSKNYIFIDPLCESDDVFEECNLMQLESGTAICKGKTGLIFRECNLTNAVVPEGSTVIGCKVSDAEFCSHKHPKWVDKFGLTRCNILCDHRQGDEKQWVDVPRKRFRISKNQIDGPVTRIVQETDADGVVEQVFQARLWVYEDTRIRRKDATK